MSRKLFQDNPNYMQSVAFLHELHALIRAGKCDDDVADELRDRMDNPWYALSADEQNRIRGMSADLYTLGPDSPIQHANRDRFISNEFAAKLGPLMMASQWDRVLDLLRETPGEISRDLAAQYRAEAYAKLGEESIAKRFLAEAWRLNPKLPDLQFVDAGIRGIFPEATAVPSDIPQSTH